MLTNGHIITDTRRSLCGNDDIEIVTGLGNCYACVVAIAEEMASIEGDLERNRVVSNMKISSDASYTAKQSLSRYTSRYCAECNCNKSDSVDTANAVTDACEKYSCICHNEGI